MFRRKIIINHTDEPETINTKYKKISSFISWAHDSKDIDDAIFEQTDGYTYDQIGLDGIESFISQLQSLLVDKEFSEEEKRKFFILCPGGVELNKILQESDQEWIDYKMIVNYLLQKFTQKRDEIQNKMK